MLQSSYYCNYCIHLGCFQKLNKKNKKLIGMVLDHLFSDSSLFSKVDILSVISCNRRL